MTPDCFPREPADRAHRCLRCWSGSAAARAQANVSQYVEPNILHSRAGQLKCWFRSCIKSFSRCFRRVSVLCAGFASYALSDARKERRVLLARIVALGTQAHRVVLVAIWCTTRDIPYAYVHRRSGLLAFATRAVARGLLATHVRRCRTVTAPSRSDPASSRAPSPAVAGPCPRSTRLGTRPGSSCRARGTPAGHTASLQAAKTEAQSTTYSCFPGEVRVCREVH